MPRGIYGVEPGDMDRASGYGFNVIQTYRFSSMTDAQVADYLDAAQKRGLKVLFTLDMKKFAGRSRNWRPCAPASERQVQIPPRLVRMVPGRTSRPVKTIKPGRTVGHLPSDQKNRSRSSRFLLQLGAAEFPRAPATWTWPQLLFRSSFGVACGSPGPTAGGRDEIRGAMDRCGQPLRHGFQGLQCVGGGNREPRRHLERGAGGQI